MGRTRTDFVNEVMGLNFRSIQGKFSFCNDQAKQVLFSLNPSNGGYLILSPKWSARGFAHSIKHIDLVRNHGYELFVYKVLLRKGEGGSTDSYDYEPRLEKRKLVVKGDDFFAYPFEETYENIREVFENSVSLSESDSAADRAKRLALANLKPTKRTVSADVFDRNPDVVAEVLYRAEGKCQRCFEFAPFKRKSNGNPYLEVHHVVPLANGGDDSVANAIALCPNCHREEHYGF